ncbi:bck1-like resistance to osmotic shock [Microbotryomycetes sp. JL201]|nr:bck1-like resistance to osmotic shock [Microbotryomycetes sp. JL201]
MSSPLIAVPRKVTQDVDFAPQLRSVITRTYGEKPDAYNDELAQLNRARQDALRGSAGSDATARDLLYKYFGQLEMLELRFPELRVPFPWSDAFTQVKISQLSLAYEKASVIFNIGATLSSLASSSTRSSPEGLKRAFHSFRCAAGMFTYINDNFLHAPSTDLSREVVKLLVGLMTAQATEVFIETMGPATQKGANLRSKLCMQTSSVYASIVEEVKEYVTKGVFSREWSLLIQASATLEVKVKYFASLAQYHRSNADTAASKYGEALARLNIAETTAKEAYRLSQAFSASFSSTAMTNSIAADAPAALLELTKTHMNLVSDTRAKAQKENDIVYNEVVPTEASLPVIEKGKEVAEPIPIHDVYASAEVQKIVGPDLFQKLVPLSVHESASMYSEEQAKLVRAETEKIDVADGELQAALEYMGLPASLERFRSGISGQAGLADPGPQVRGWMDEVRQQEGQGRIDDLFRRIDMLKNTVSRNLDKAAHDLDTESRECEAMRVKYGHLWEQQPASPLTRSYRQDIKSHRGSLEQASASDAQAQGLWDAAKRDVALLLDSSALNRAFAEAVGSSSQPDNSLLDTDLNEEEEQETRKRVEAISEDLSRLSKIKRERAEVLKDLKEKVQADDISHILILNRKGSAAVEPQLFATELEKFRPHQQRIMAAIHQQQQTLSEVSTDFKALQGGSKAKEAQGRWAEAEMHKRDLVSRLGRAAQAYADVREGLKKGVQFYQDLNELVDGLTEQVSSYLQSRENERSEMASAADIKQRLEGPRVSSPGVSLDRQMGSLHLGGSGSPPPPPPSMPNPPSWQQRAPYSAYPTTSDAPPAPPPLPQQQPSYGYPSSSAAPPSANPYGSIPSTGAFSMAPVSSPYTSQSSPAAATSPALAGGSAYAVGGANTRPQTTLPPPSQPMSYGSLPPPSQPVSYASTGYSNAQAPSSRNAPQGAYYGHGHPTSPPPPLPPTTSTPYYAYGSNYNPPPAPPRPY